MSTMLIVHRPDECPRIGYLNPADELASMREWQASNPGASIYVVQASIELPSPGTAWVDTIEQAIFNAEWANGPDADEWPDSELPEASPPSSAARRVRCNDRLGGTGEQPPQPWKCYGKRN